MIAAAELRAVYCATQGCRMAHRPIAHTNGTEAQAYCGSCRRWTWWRAG